MCYTAIINQEYLVINSAKNKSSSAQSQKRGDGMHNNYVQLNKFLGLLKVASSIIKIDTVLSLYNPWSPKLSCTFKDYKTVILIPSHYVKMKENPDEGNEKQDMILRLKNKNLTILVVKNEIWELWKKQWS